MATIPTSGFLGGLQNLGNALSSFVPLVGAGLQVAGAIRGGGGGMQPVAMPGGAQTMQPYNPVSPAYYTPPTSFVPTTGGNPMMTPTSFWQGGTSLLNQGIDALQGQSGACIVPRVTAGSVRMPHEVTVPDGRGGFATYIKAPKTRWRVVARGKRRCSGGR